MLTKAIKNGDEKIKQCKKLYNSIVLEFITKNKENILLHLEKEFSKGNKVTWIEIKDGSFLKPNRLNKIHQNLSLKECENSVNMDKIRQILNIPSIVHISHNIINHLDYDCIHLLSSCEDIIIFIRS